MVRILDGSFGFIDLYSMYRCLMLWELEVVTGLLYDVPVIYTAIIRNREHLGKTADELIARWNEQHPNDPVTE
jgi:hypothetical protein